MEDQYKPQTASVRASETLGMWEPKRTLTLEAARRHSARIRFLRLALMGVAAFLLLSLTWGFATQQTNFIVDDNPGESVKMINPRYSGRTKDGLPYKLTSKSAIRLTQNAEEVALDSPVLNFIRTVNVEPSIVTAQTGQYNDVDQVLDLETAVELKTDDGYHCITGQARVFAGDKRIEGDKPITCTGNFGRVSGQAFDILKDYSEFMFKDGTEGYLTPKKTQDPPKDQNAQDGATENADKSETAETAQFGFAGNQPIFVTSDLATYKSGLTILNGNVDVKQGEDRIQSDEMYIYRERTKNENSSGVDGSLKLGALTEIDARGNFRYSSPDNVVTGKKGVYDQVSGVITVTGNVRATQPSGNIIRSERLKYNVRNKTIRFGDKCVGENCNTRTKMRFTPNK